MLLGLKPTLSERAVHDAFGRVERIYRPERFVGDLPDVRAAVQHLRQQAVNAYAYLCARQRELRTAPPPGAKRDPWEVARRYREQIAERRSDVLEQEARHARWSILEEEAKERARREAEMASMFTILPEPDEPDPASTHPAQAPDRSLLQTRLDEARAALQSRGERSAHDSNGHDV